MFVGVALGERSCGRARSDCASPSGVVPDAPNACAGGELQRLPIVADAENQLMPSVSMEVEDAVEHADGDELHW